MIYEVESLVSHSLVADGLWFEVKWLGYGEEFNTWEPVSGLAGSYEIIKEYLERNNLCELKDRVIFDEDDDEIGDSNPNLIDPAMVIQLILKYQSMLPSYRSSIMVEQFHGDLALNRLYIILHKGHYYVLFNGEQGSWLADGANSCFEDEIYEELKALLALGPTLRRVRYLGQVRSDHCGSSAILIGLGMLGEARKGWIDGGPSLLTGSKTLRSRLIRQLHPVRSEGLGLQARIGQLGWQKCRRCGRSFRTKDRRGLAQHERACK